MTQAVVRSKDVDVEGVRKRLEEIKRQRIEEAKRLGIGEMVRFVVEVFGEADFYGCDRFYRAGGLVLRSNCVHGASVAVEGRLVYDEENHEPVLYVPGTWVTTLINLHKAAKIRAAKERVKAQLEAIRKEAERWGLAPEDLGLCSEDLSV